MRLGSPLTRGFIVCSALGLAQIAAAQPAAAPTIHRVLLQPDAGVLTIVGTALGPDLLVTVDGQPVTTLPGATDTQIEVQVPTTLLTTPGTYRLTVVDPVRHVGDGFVVASSVGSVVAASAAPGDRMSADALAPAPEERRAWPTDRAARGSNSTGASPKVIEDPSNTAVGQYALVSNTTGYQNTAIGVYALGVNTTGFANTASGARALLSNSTGWYNTASGAYAMDFNTTGSGNTATGAEALNRNATGFANTATGAAALASNTTGTYNTAVGRSAGLNATTGSYNVFIGAGVSGTAADTNTIRIGLPYDGGTGAGQTHTFIAGIWGRQITGTAAQVFIDANGQLGTGTPVAMLSGTGSLVTPVAVDQQLREQRAINADLQRRSQAQQATIDDLLARLARLEAASPRRR